MSSIVGDRSFLGNLVFILLLRRLLVEIDLLSLSDCLLRNRHVGLPVGIIDYIGVLRLYA